MAAVRVMCGAEVYLLSAGIGVVVAMDGCRSAGVAAVEADIDGGVRV